MSAWGSSCTAIAWTAALVACGGSGVRGETSADEEPVAVRTAPVEEEALAIPVGASGTLGPKEEIALSFKVGGVIDRVLVDAGARVRAGDTLAALDLREIDAGVARAQSGTEKAERDLARVRRLYDDSVATRAQVQDAETAARIARADLDAARFNRRYAVIVAPARGVLLRRLAEPGEIIAPGIPVVLLGSRGRGTVMRVGLADRDVVRVQLGDSARVRLDALPQRVFDGVVSEVAAAAEPGTGTYAVEIAVPTAVDLAAGLVGRVEIRPSRSQRMMIVPIEAILEADGTEATVFALSADGRRAERRRVTVAFIAGDRVAIGRGLTGVQVVVTEGAAYLRDGDIVRIMP